MHEGELTKEQLQAAKLREKYAEKKLSPLEKAEMLDKLATAKARSAAIVFGCAGTMVFGAGMSCILAWHISLMPYGIIVACLGGIMCACAPLLHRLLKRTEMNKVAAEILELTKDI